MEQQQLRITCPKCGRSGPGRPDMAGKKVKCKCGNVILVPAIEQSIQSNDPDEPIKVEPIARPRQTTAPPPQEHDEYDVREPMPQPTAPVERPADVIAYQSAPVEGPTAAAAPAAPTFHAFRPKTYKPEEGADYSQIIRLVILLAVVITIIGGSILAIHYLGGSHSVTANLPGEDSDIEQSMQDQYCKEVHAWFTEDNTRIMGPWSQQQAIQQADRWKEMGAKNVFALGTRISTVAIIELPDDQAHRAQLIQWEIQWHRDHFQKLWGDVGQKYLMIRLGI